MSVTGHHLCNILARVNRVNLKQYLLLNYRIPPTSTIYAECPKKD